MTDDAAAPLRIGWFASGLGTGSRALLSAAQGAIDRGELRAEIPFLFCNREPGEHENSDLLLAMAEQFGISTVTLSDRRFRRRVSGEVARAGQPLPSWRYEYDQAVMDLIAPYGTNLGMLAGYMLIFGREACERYNFLNLHPAAPGGPIGTWQRVIWQLIDQRAAESGVLINRAIPEVDEGPVVAYCRYPLRGPDIDPLWDAIGSRTADDLREAVGEALPLFQAIRGRGVRFEIPLTVQALVALAVGRVRMVDGAPVAGDVPLPNGLNLTSEVARAVFEATRP